MTAPSSVPSRTRRSPATRSRARLERLYHRFNVVDAATDPVQIVHRYADPADQEVVAFVASALAFGRVASVLQSVETVVEQLGPSPARFVRRYDPRRDGQRFRGFTHRWVRGTDVSALLWIMRHMLERGSIEACFAEHHDPEASDIGPALEAFSATARSVDLGPAYGRVPPRPGVYYFFSRPGLGGACKRLNLFLRWMVRRDAVDLGVWTRVRPSVLVIPLDVHIERVGRCLGLTARRSPGWRMAVDITQSLKAFAPEDPVRYDFSLCHIGMAGLCGLDLPHGDTRCPLAGLCRPG